MLKVAAGQALPMVTGPRADTAEETARTSRVKIVNAASDMFFGSRVHVRVFKDQVALERQHAIVAEMETDPDAQFYSTRR